MAILDVNTDAAIALTAKLEKLHKSAFPSAVRNTLNDVAFDMKKNIPIVAKDKFITRQPAFFKRMSVVEKASGFNVNKMAAITGIDASKDSQLAENLARQETGGQVDGKKIIPHDDSRVSRNNKKRVAAVNRMNKVKIHDASRAFKARSASKSSRFVSAVMSTAKAGRKYMLLKSGNRGMIYELSSVSQNSKNRKFNFKLKKLYVYRPNKNHAVKSNKYLADSANLSIKKIESFYKKNAEFQFNKFLK